MHGIDSLLYSLGEQGHKAKSKAIKFIRQASIFTLLVVAAIASITVSYFLSTNGYDDLSIAMLWVGGMSIAGSIAYWVESFRKKK